MADSEHHDISDHGMLNDEEFFALGRISHAMLQYHNQANSEITRWQWNYDNLSPRHKALLPGMTDKISKAQAAVSKNAATLTAIVEAGDVLRDIGPSLQAAKWHASQRAAVTPLDASKVRYTLKNLVRDWSAEGAKERAQSYGWIVERACDLFPDRTAGDPPSVLVPGAGLARLPVDLAAKGFAAVGNEFSFYMLLTSSYLMNFAQSKEALTIHPFVTNSSNQLSDDAQLRGVSIPDLPPGEALRHAPGNLGIITGDFVEVFATGEYEDAFDVVATCFFIDTAHNILEYIEVIKRCLKAGGYWINVGPLLYHWASEGDGRDRVGSLELSLADVLSAARDIGFKDVVYEEADAAYIGDIHGMYSTSYKCARWVMQSVCVEEAASMASSSLAHTNGKPN